MKASIGAFLGALLMLFVAAPAAAQAPAPIGFWVTSGGEERLLVTERGQCSLADQTGRMVSGPCSWQSSSRGGTLTILAQQLYRPAPVYLAVVWVDNNTIRVQGDVFYRQG